MDRPFNSLDASHQHGLLAAAPPSAAELELGQFPIPLTPPWFARALVRLKMDLVGSGELPGARLLEQTFVAVAAGREKARQFFDGVSAQTLLAVGMRRGTWMLSPIATEAAAVGAFAGAA